MALREEFAKQGDWLFRWRSFLPLVLVPFVVLALIESADASMQWGSPADTIYSAICMGFSLIGLVIRALTIGFAPKGTSGGNTKIQRAYLLNTTGTYSLVRHPLYLGNFVIFLGILLFLKIWWFVCIGILVFWLYYERIMYREEEFLREKFGEQHLRWSDRIPAFIPRFRTWQRPDLHFSAWRVIQREYRGLFEIIICFTLLAIIRDYLQKGEYVFHMGWTIFFGSGLAMFILLRVVITLKKIKTKRQYVATETQRHRGDEERIENIEQGTMK